MNRRIVEPPLEAEQAFTRRTPSVVLPFKLDLVREYNMLPFRTNALSDLNTLAKNILKNVTLAFSLVAMIPITLAHAQSSFVVDNQITAQRGVQYAGTYDGTHSLSDTGISGERWHIFQNPDNPIECVVRHRGTTDPDEVIDDVSSQLALTWIKNGVWLNNAFRLSYLRYAGELKNGMYSAMNTKGCYIWDIVGHSLGAAVAAIHATDLSKEFHIRDVHMISPPRTFREESPKADLFCIDTFFYQCPRVNSCENFKNNITGLAVRYNRMNLDGFWNDSVGSIPLGWHHCADYHVGLRSNDAFGSGPDYGDTSTNISADYPDDLLLGLPGLAPWLLGAAGIIEADWHADYLYRSLMKQAYIENYGSTDENYGSTDGAVQLKAKHSGKCLDVSGWSHDNGANVRQTICHRGDKQNWILNYLGQGAYEIRAKHSNKCLDVSGVSSNNGANIHQWSCTGGDNQKWILTKTFQNTMGDARTYSTRPNEDGSGNAIYLDRHKANCGANGMRSFRLYRPSNSRIAYQYSCASTGDSGVSAWNATPANNDGGGHTAYLDRHGINCGSKPIKAFRLTRPSSSQIAYDYKCGGEDLSNVSDRYTPWDGNGNNRGNLIYLDRQNVACEGNEFLTHARLQTDWNSGKYRYHYRCGTK